METVAGNTGRTGDTWTPDGADPVGDAIAELYAGDPDAFVERRRELASQARAAGNREAAKAIAGLGKPTRSAWIVNNLIHADPGVAVSLAELGGKLRSGDALDGANIRELSRERRELVDALVRRAMAEASQGSPSVALRDEVTDTFNAALADPDVAEQVTAGTLLKAVHWAGFGPGIGSAVSSGPARAPAARTSEADEAEAGTARKTAAAGRPGARTTGAPAGATGARARARTSKASATERADARAAGDEESAEQREAARLAAEAAAERDRQERRDIITRAEEAAAEASEAADAAAATEREISDSVTFMQERLNREQQRLVQARRDTRQAAAAATRAKQTLERIRRQFS